MFKYSLLISLFVLGACAGTPQNAPHDTPESKPVVTPETVKVEPDVAPAPTPPPPPPAKPKITSRQLLGQGGPWVIAKLGDPSFVRSEKTANIWQYKNGHCVLNLFLYVDGDQQAADPKVLHFDARDAQGSNTDRDHCLAHFQDD